MGSALARALNVAGHTVTVTARNSGHAEKVAGELKVAAAGSNREAVQDADMVVLAVPSKAVAAVVEGLDDVLGQAIVVDPTNPSGLDRREIPARVRMAGRSDPAARARYPGGQGVQHGFRQPTQ